MKKMTVFITGADKKLLLIGMKQEARPFQTSLESSLQLPHLSFRARNHSPPIAPNQFTKISLKVPVVLVLVVDFTRNPTVPIEGACEFKVITGVPPLFQNT